MAAVGGLFEVRRSLTHHNHAFILYIDPPCTTTAEYTFSKRLNSLILAIYHQTNIRVDHSGPFCAGKPVLKSGHSRMEPLHMSSCHAFFNGQKGAGTV